MNIPNGHELFVVTQEFDDLRHSYLERKVGLTAIIAAQDIKSLELEVITNLSDQEWEQYKADDEERDPEEFEDLLNDPLTVAEIEFSNKAKDIFGVVGDYELCNTLPGQLFLKNDKSDIYTSLFGKLNQKGEITLNKILRCNSKEAFEANVPLKMVINPSAEDVEIIRQAIQRLDAVNIELKLIS